MVAVVWSVKPALAGRAVPVALVELVMTPVWLARRDLPAAPAVLAVMAVLRVSAGSMGMVGTAAPVLPGDSVGPALRWPVLVARGAMAVTVARRVPVPVVRG